MRSFLSFCLSWNAVIKFGLAAKHHRWNSFLILNNTVDSMASTTFSCWAKRSYYKNELKVRRPCLKSNLLLQNVNVLLFFVLWLIPVLMPPHIEPPARILDSLQPVVSVTFFCCCQFLMYETPMTLHFKNPYIDVLHTAHYTYSSIQFNWGGKEGS